ANPERVAYSLNPFRVDSNGTSSPGLAAKTQPTLGFVSQPFRGCLPGPPLSFQSQMYKLQNPAQPEVTCDRYQPTADSYQVSG
ncbi:MAG: hypothetical protein JXA73_13875, partial [Acidobacteria bacterium]|nr:hypothetical protein [Acidobacteriota bacterium]